MVTANKQNSGRGYLITATFDMGPFKTVAAANAGIKKVRQTNPKAVVEKVRKLKVGYKFATRVYFFTKTAKAAGSIMKDIKAKAPSARVSKKQWKMRG